MSHDKGYTRQTRSAETENETAGNYCYGIGWWWSVARHRQQHLTLFPPNSSLHLHVLVLHLQVSLSSVSYALYSTRQMPSQDTPAPIIRISQLPPSAPPSPHPSQPPTPEPGTPALTTPPSHDERESRSKHVRLQFEEEKPRVSTWRRWYERVISHHWFSWVPGKASLWPNWKPVIRCALAVSDAAPTSLMAGVDRPGYTAHKSQ